jgi:transposase
MPSTEMSSNALRSQGRLSEEVKAHKLVKAMKREGRTFAELREALKEETGRAYAHSTVLSWVKPKGDPAARGIPEEAAKAIQALYGVPLSAWSRVIPKR